MEAIVCSLYIATGKHIPGALDELGLFAVSRGRFRVWAKMKRPHSYHSRYLRLDWRCVTVKFYRLFFHMSLDRA